MYRCHVESRIVQRGLVCVLIPLMVLSLSGCGKPPLETEPVTIQFAHRDIDSDYYQALATQFAEQYPQITVELAPKRGGELQSREAFTADCLVTSAEVLGQYRAQRSAGQPLPMINLDDLVEVDRSFDVDDLYPGALELVKSEGKLWGIPAGISPIVMYYNKDLFDERQVAYPSADWTWDDFLEAALATHNAEVGIWGYVPASDILDPLLVVYQHGGGILDDVQMPTRATFDDPVTVEALQWYADLFHEHQVAPSTPEQLGGGDSLAEAARRSAFTSRVAMWSGQFDERGGEWGWGRYRWNFRWGMAPLPRDARSATYADVEVYAISATADSVSACWQWIRFVSMQTNTQSRQIPARRSVVESSEYEQLVGEEVAAVARAAVESAITLPSTEVLIQFQGAFEAFSQAVEKIVTGEWTAQEAMVWAQREAGN